MKAMQSEIKENVQGTNSDGKETGTQINDMKQKKEINIQLEQNKQTAQTFGPQFTKLSRAEKIETGTTKRYLLPSKAVLTFISYPSSLGITWHQVL